MCTPSPTARSVNTASSACSSIAICVPTGVGSRQFQRPLSTLSSANGMPAKWPPNGRGCASQCAVPGGGAPLSGFSTWDAATASSRPRRSSASRVGAFKPRRPSGKRFRDDPGDSACSSTRTEPPARASSQDRNRPTGPAPAMTTSYSIGTSS
ncbi:hypothetical protein G6F32_014035 [Rhizopus arrhizus]|nr:hypothetical protein G6F32_014035 [Rhizopus arrhizus]